MHEGRNYALPITQRERWDLGTFIHFGGARLLVEHYWRSENRCPEMRSLVLSNWQAEPHPIMHFHLLPCCPPLGSQIDQ